MDPTISAHQVLAVDDRRMLSDYLGADGSEWHDLDTYSPHATSTALRSLEAWVWGFDMWSREVLVRAALASLEHTLTPWHDGDDDDEIVQATRVGDVTSPVVIHRAVAAWVLKPSVDAAVRADALLEKVPDFDLTLPEYEPLAQQASTWAIVTAANAVAATNHDTPRRFAGRAAVAAARGGLLRDPQRGIASVQNAIRAALEKWLAGG